MFRSEEVVRCQLFIQPEASYPTVAMLGEAGIAQFTDMKPHLSVFQRKFVGEVRRCDELERKLRYVESELKKECLLVTEQRVQVQVPAPQLREILEVENHLEKAENELIELGKNAINLKATFVELAEMKLVVESVSGFLTEQEEGDPSRALQGQGADDPGQLGFVAGVVVRDRVAAFERMLWRISRGNVFVRLVELPYSIEDPVTGEKVRKTAFVVFFQGDNLKAGVRKVCEGFRARTYPCPSSASERADVVRTLRVRLADITLVLGQTQLHRKRVLVTVRRELREWVVMVRKMKAIYHTLNMFDMDVTNKCFIGECWVPVNDLPALQRALHDGGRDEGNNIPSFLNIIQTTENTPTFIRTNKFSSGFQALVDAYAIPSYMEVNPGLFTIVSFPFLFSVMFGDLGHGVLMALFALYMVLNETKLARAGGGEIWRIMFGGRYIILMMGVFSMYTGIIYNDVFSVSLNIFKSSWNSNFDLSTLNNNNFLDLDPATSAYSQQPYPIGLDPVWQMAHNKIVFLNSFKMKLSIIIGVVHMIFGLALSCINLVDKKKWFSVAFEFIPQLLFLILLFGYLAMLMIAKWIMYGATSDPAQRRRSSSCAPSVLITFINMMLLSEERGAPGCDTWMFPGQGALQKGLLFTALACVPVLLLAHPLRAACAARAARAATPRASRSGQIIGADSEEDIRPDELPPEEHAGEPLGEVIVFQAIHTIEYVLSTVSHTASYLRLWALSLAHAQLSEVLWRMVLRRAFVDGSKGQVLQALGVGQTVARFEGALYLFLIFPAWAALTVAILVLMEGLSAFLHTLRLHWVEFMSKFFEGAGEAFHPFSFKELFKSEDGD